MKLITILDTEIQGVVYAFDGASNCLAIVEASASNEARLNNYRIIKTSFLKTVQVIKGEKSKESSKARDTKIGEVDIEQLKLQDVERQKQLQKQKLQELRDKQTELNVRQIPELAGKEIYRKIVKLLPIEEVGISNQSIIIFNNIKISPPYDVQNVVVKDFKEGEKDSRVESSIEFIRNIVSSSQLAGG